MHEYVDGLSSGIFFKAFIARWCSSYKLIRESVMIWAVQGKTLGFTIYSEISEQPRRNMGLIINRSKLFLIIIISI